FYVMFFFFQAEDGIRDFHVTGVQTLLFRSPGVCQLQIVKETLQDLLQKKIRISSVANVKYLQLMTPDTVCKLLINWSLNDDNLTIKSEYKNETSFSKMNLKGRVEN